MLAVAESYDLCDSPVDGYVVREREREERERPDFDSQQLFSFSLFMGSHVSQLFEIRFVLLFLFIPVRRETLKLVCRVHQAIPIAAHDLNGHLQ